MTQTKFTEDDLEAIASTGLIISGSIGCGKTYVAQYLFEKLKTYKPIFYFGHVHLFLSSRSSAL